MSTTTSPVRTGHTAGDGHGASRKDLRAPQGPRADHARRRVFIADYKLAVLAEYDRCTEPGEKGALLRWEGLYSLIITDWRRQHREGTLVVTNGRASEGGRGAPS